MKGGEDHHEDHSWRISGGGLAIGGGELGPADDQHHHYEQEEQDAMIDAEPDEDIRRVAALRGNIERQLTGVRFFVIFYRALTASSLLSLALVVLSSYF